MMARALMASNRAVSTLPVLRATTWSVVLLKVVTRAWG